MIRIYHGIVLVPFSDTDPSRDQPGFKPRKKATAQSQLPPAKDQIGPKLCIVSTALYYTEWVPPLQLYWSINDTRNGRHLYSRYEKIYLLDNVNIMHANGRGLRAGLKLTNVYPVPMRRTQSWVVTATAERNKKEDGIFATSLATSKTELCNENGNEHKNFICRWHYKSSKITILVLML